jgi:hypothetical protein
VGGGGLSKHGVTSIVIFMMYCNILAANMFPIPVRLCSTVQMNMYCVQYTYSYIVHLAHIYTNLTFL